MIGNLGLFDGAGERFTERHKAALVIASGCKVEQTFFGLLDLVLRGDVNVVRIGIVHDIFAQRYQCAAQVQFVNRAAVIFDVDHADDVSGQIGEILAAADAGEILVFFEIAFEGDRACVLPALYELDDRVKNTAMHGVVEMLGA